MKSFIKKALYVLFHQLKGPQHKERITSGVETPYGSTLSEADMKDDEKVRVFIIFIVKDKPRFNRLLTDKNFWERYVVPVLVVLGPLLAVVAAILALV